MRKIRDHESRHHGAEEVTVLETVQAGQTPQFRTTVVSGFPDGRSVETSIAAQFARASSTSGWTMTPWPIPRAQAGLTRIASLPQTAGMLFIFARTGHHRLWMPPDMLIPLDMIWLSDTGVVVELAADVPPCQHPPCDVYGGNTQSRFALELAAGAIARKKIALGMLLEF